MKSLFYSSLKFPEGDTGGSSEGDTGGGSGGAEQGVPPGVRP